MTEPDMTQSKRRGPHRWKDRQRGSEGHSEPESSKGGAENMEEREEESRRSAGGGGTHPQALSQTEEEEEEGEGRRKMSQWTRMERREKDRERFSLGLFSWICLKVRTHCWVLNSECYHSIRNGFIG